MNKLIAILSIVLISASSCNMGSKSSTVDLDKKTPFIWENANVYFLLTDRFSNGNKENDINFSRTIEAAPERGFQGGDFQGIINKINNGYFSKLGITALWFSPIAEQVHAGVDEGTGFTYAYHGYWAKDWTKIEPNFGTEDEFAELVDTAHKHGIRVLMDVVINHTGPVTDLDPQWDNDWVRTEPTCTYKDYKSTTACTLVENLPDVKTESNEIVTLPTALMDKWEKEGRLESELVSLDRFFEESGLAKSPRFYIIKWLVDFIKKYGIDGFRLDTVKHTDASLWAELAKEAQKGFDEWKANNPDKVLDDNDFYMVGEVYGYSISNGQVYDNGGVDVNYFKEGDMQSLINFEFKYNADQLNYEELFKKYSDLLHNELNGYSVLNYITSHDDGQPYDKERIKNFEGGTKLLLCPGKSQVYYGDESIRNLIIEGTEGDATLRSFMNWDEISSNSVRNNDKVQDVLAHYQKLGNFRKSNPSVGAGKHNLISSTPYVFKRTFTKGDYNNNVVVALDMAAGEKQIPVEDLFKNGSTVKDYYTGTEVVIKNNMAVVNSPYSIVLLGQ